MCCNLQKAARERWVESTGLRLMQPPPNNPVQIAQWKKRALTTRDVERLLVPRRQSSGLKQEIDAATSGDPTEVLHHSSSSRLEDRSARHGSCHGKPL